LFRFAAPRRRFGSDNAKRFRRLSKIAVRNTGSRVILAGRPQRAPKECHDQGQKGQYRGELSREAFNAHFDKSFAGPAFDQVRAAIERLKAIAWDGHIDGRKAPIAGKAGKGFADPDHELSVPDVRPHSHGRNEKPRQRRRWRG
jgi:hypothetical protein